MNIWGKIFGGTSGFVVGGPLGGLLGIFAGHAIDKFSKKKLPESIAVKQINFTTFSNTQLPLQTIDLV